MNSLLTRIRFTLIKWLAGRDSIGINIVLHNGTLLVQPGHTMLLSNWYTGCTKEVGSVTGMTSMLSQTVEEVKKSHVCSTKIDGEVMG